MTYVNIDGALARLRSLAQQIISGDVFPSTATVLAQQCVEIDEHLVGGGLLPKDWEVGKRLAWRDGKGGSMVLEFNGVAVGHAYPGSESGWVCQADMVPSQERPYRVESKLLKAETMEGVMLACETYVREQTKNVFDPWVALKREGLI